LKTTSPGNEFSGVLDMTYNNSTSQNWTITANDLTAGTSTSNNVSINETGAFNAAQNGVLEAYGVSSCSAFPSGSSGWTYWNAPNMYQGTSYNDRIAVTPSWFLWDYNGTGWSGPICNFSASNVDSIGNTNLDY
jgi:hypothetical protein